MTHVTRRAFLGRSLAAIAAAAAAPSLHGFDAPLGFMLHAVRARAARDLAGTLRQVASLGYTEVELVSFKGYSSAAPRDGFGPLAPMAPADIRAVIRDAGLTVSSAHFKFEEFGDERLADSLEWAHGVGLEYMTVSDIPPTTTLDGWNAHFATLNRLGTRLRREGLRLGLHTQNDLWRAYGDVVVLDALLREVDPAACAVQLDLSTAQSMGVDAVSYLRRYPSRFFALHLRDAKTPPRRGEYVFSVPLGEGDLDLKTIISAARAAGVRTWIVEMQVQAPADPIAALQRSAAYLRALDVERRRP
jgi:sugar phosphate isomerase/epimerase